MNQEKNVCESCGADGAGRDGFCRLCDRLGEEEFSFQYGSFDDSMLSGNDLEA